MNEPLQSDLCPQCGAYWSCDCDAPMRYEPILSKHIDPTLVEAIEKEKGRIQKQIDDLKAEYPELQEHTQKLMSDAAKRADQENWDSLFKPE